MVDIKTTQSSWKCSQLNLLNGIGSDDKFDYYWISDTFFREKERKMIQLISNGVDFIH